MKNVIPVCSATCDEKDTSLPIPPPAVPQNLVALNDDTLLCQPEHETRRFQTSTWFRIENGKRIYLLHERTYFFSPPKSTVTLVRRTPAQIFYTACQYLKEPQTYYWLTTTDFATPEDALKTIAERAAKPETWSVQKDWYGDGYFLITSDFDDALAVLGYKYAGNGLTSAPQPDKVAA